MNEADERQLLERFSSPIEADVQTRDPTATIEWFVEDGMWSYRLFDASSTFDESGDIDEPGSESLRQDAILKIAWNVADNLWPDEWTDPWPRCPSHRDHPLQPQMSGGTASWVCLRNPAIAIPIGSLRKSA